MATRRRVSAKGLEQLIRAARVDDKTAEALRTANDSKSTPGDGPPAGKKKISSEF